MTTRRRRTTATLVFGMVLSATAAGAQTVDEIVALHYQSRGGQEAWKAIETQRMTGTIHAQGIEIALVSLSRRPHLMRQELTLEIPGTGPVHIVNIFDGKTAWSLNPMSGSSSFQELTGLEAQRMRDQSAFDSPLMGFKDRGYTVEIAGRTDLDGRTAHHLRITRPDEPVMHLYIDAVTGSELRIDVDGPAPTRVTLSDHRLVAGGVLMPHHISLEQGGMQSEVIVSSIEFDVPIDDSAFKAP